jgi:cytoskeletal protein CcmA (bactofilin family)
LPFFLLFVDEIRPFVKNIGVVKELLTLLWSTRNHSDMKKLLYLFCAMFAISNLSADNVKVGSHLHLTEPVKSNYYAAAGKFNASTTIEGDLNVAAGELRFEGSIQKDALLAGGKVNFEAQSAGDVRIIGGEIKITQNIAGDLVVSGGEVHIAQGVTIGGDLIVGGGKVHCYGKVLGNAHLAAGEMTLSGDISGNLLFKGGRLYLNGKVEGTSSIAAERLELGDKAYFNSAVQYWCKHDRPNFAGKTAAEVNVVFNRHLKPSWADYEHKAYEFAYKAKRGYSVFRIFSGILMVLLLIAFGDKFFSRYAGQARSNAGPALGLGVMLMIGLPILSGLAFMTVIGIPVGMIGMGVYGIMMSMTAALPAVVAAYEIRKARTENWQRGGVTLVALGLFLGLRLIAQVSFFGSLVSFVVAAIAFGYIYLIMRRKIQVTPTDTTPGDGGKDEEDLV